MHEEVIVIAAQFLLEFFARITAETCPGFSPALNPCSPVVDETPWAQRVRCLLAFSSRCRNCRCEEKGRDVVEEHAASPAVSLWTQTMHLACVFHG